MECTEKMLAAAMAKAVQVGLLPKQVASDEYLKNWANMKAVLEAALSSAPQ
jgi:hypothetical protein